MKFDRSELNDADMIKEITGAEFRDSGMLWFVNNILHAFGMALLGIQIQMN